MQPLRHGYTNDTRGDGTVVVKRYAGPGDAGARWLFTFRTGSVLNRYSVDQAETLRKRVSTS
jgi:hypothetical protein